MQMYEVWFQVDHGACIDVGRAIVQAQDQNLAKQTIIEALDLPVSSLTRCDVKRIKPNLFLLERKDVGKPQDVVVAAETLDDAFASRKGLRAWANELGEDREYRREMDNYIAQQSWAMRTHGRAESMEFDCEVFAVVVATSEDEALRRLASALLERSRGVVDESRYVKKVMVDLKSEY